MAVLLTLLGAAAYILGFIALVAVVDGWALMLLWNWFAVTLLGLPPISSIPAAIGIGLVVSLLTSSPTSSKDRTVPEALAYLFARPLAVVLVGYIVHRFFL